jgi:alkaline phosphatase
LGLDGKPYATLGYANGPYYFSGMDTDGKRKDLSLEDLENKDYKFPANYPLSLETHAGDDVAVSSFVVDYSF